MSKQRENPSNQLNVNTLDIGGENPYVSIVMPAYNASKYIRDSIQSILRQDFQNFELIIADDCSNDNTVAIISSFKDKRIRLIHTEQNTGSAKYPRELAIEHSRSPYICWIDSDDTVDPNYLSQLINTKIKTKANIVCSQMLAKRNGHIQYTLPKDDFDYNSVISGRDAVMMTLDRSWKINLNGWLCDKEIWMGVSSFKNPNIIHMDADDFSAREILYKAPSVAFCKASYHYRLHSDAITKKISTKKFESVITDRLVFEYFRPIYPEAIPLIHRALCSRMIALMRIFSINIAQLTPDDQSYSKKLLQKYFNKIRMADILQTDIPFRFKILLMMPFNWTLTAIKIIN